MSFMVTFTKYNQVDPMILGKLRTVIAGVKP